MDEEKIQRLHDTLSKLGKGRQGLGTSSHYSFGGGIQANNNIIPIKEGQDGQMYREDGLPVNALYANFVKQGSYKKQDSALKYGDGRVIKRNFDDCTPDLGEDDGSSSSSTKSARRRKKEKKKALKKAEKIEAKKKAKLEAKKQAKLEEKRRAKLEAKKKAKSKEKILEEEASKSDERKNNDKEKDKNSKKSRKEKKEKTQKKKDSSS